MRVFSSWISCTQCRKMENRYIGIGSPQKTRQKCGNKPRADVYLAGANAVTLDGKLLFIDGTGNRTAAITFDPGRVILVIGKNKLAADENAGFHRIRTEACPLNARRLHLRTPCALTGRCTDCASEQRMCNVFLTLERCPGAHPVEVLLVDEALGF